MQNVFLPPHSLLIHGQELHDQGASHPKGSLRRVPTEPLWKLPLLGGPSASDSSSLPLLHQASAEEPLQEMGVLYPVFTCTGDTTSLVSLAVLPKTEWERFTWSSHFL